MSRVEASIDVNVAVRTAYDQWTQFEEFPRFMEGVEQVVQHDDTRLTWTAEIAGHKKTWEAKITDQQPDQVISWESTEGAQNSGIVTFDELGPAQTRVNLTMEYDPEGPVENAGDILGFVDRRVNGDLKRFKEFIEGRGQETGAWRGSISGGQATSGSGAGGSGGMSGGSSGATGGGAAGGGM